MKILAHEVIEQKIFLIRNHRVMMDKDLAKLYGVSTKRLNEQVKRNVGRFPEDFMFQLTGKEAIALRSQFATSKKAGSLRSQNATLKRGRHSKYLPYAFTEQGVAMLSSVLNSKRAIDVNIAIIRVFVKLRQILSTHKELSYKLRELERKIEKHDAEIQSIFEAIHQLMTVPEKPKRKIGFHPI